MSKIIITQEVQVVIKFSARDRDGNLIAAFQDEKGQLAPSITVASEEGPLNQDFLLVALQFMLQKRKELLTKLNPRKPKGVNDGNQSKTEVQPVA